jgi:hypothetical protein
VDAFGDDAIEAAINQSYAKERFFFSTFSACRPENAEQSLRPSDGLVGTGQDGRHVARHRSPVAIR